MGLQSIFADAAAAVFEAADDIPQSIKIRRTTSGTYNPATGTTSTTTSDTPCKGVIGTYKQSEIDGTSIKTTDRRVTVLQAAVAGLGTITTSDKVVVAGTSRTIVNVGQDAACVLWILQVRG